MREALVSAAASSNGAAPEQPKLPQFQLADWLPKVPEQPKLPQFQLAAPTAGRVGDGIWGAELGGW